MTISSNECERSQSHAYESYLEQTFLPDANSARAFAAHAQGATAVAPGGPHDFLIARAGNQLFRSPARLQPWQPMAAASVAEKNRSLVAHELTEAAGEIRRTPEQGRPLLLATAGRESPHPVAVWGHAAQDCGAPFTSGIGEL
jgi:hypothetical protein